MHGRKCNHERDLVHSIMITTAVETGFSGRKPPRRHEVVSGALGEAYAQKRFLSKSMWAPTLLLCGAASTVNCRVQFYSVQFYSVVVEQTPCLAQQRAASEVKLEQIAQSKEWGAGASVDEPSTASPRRC